MTSSSRIQVFLCVLGWNLLSCASFQATTTTTTTSHRRATLLPVHTLRDADFMESLVGGERYEMVPLPDSMLETTLFVGNLNEFTQDGDLSNLFQSVSTLASLPACVARKANMHSLEYGFVSFPSIQEKEIALLKFHKVEFMGRTLKVEEIRDHPKQGRVKVPERMVAYCSGALKKTRQGNVNTLRRIARLEQPASPPPQEPPKQPQQQPPSSSSSSLHKKRRQRKQSQPQQEDPAFARAIRQGFCTLENGPRKRGGGTVVSSSSRPLTRAHRAWCLERGVPQILMCKSFRQTSPLDTVLVDLAPLRRSPTELMDYQEAVLVAAQEAGMELRPQFLRDNCNTDDDNDNDGEEEEAMCALARAASTHQSCNWETDPIHRLPVLSLGVFEGERSQAKAMAKALALLWNIPEETVDVVEGDSSSSSSNHHRLGGGPRTKARRKHKKDENRRQRRQARIKDAFF